jgi:mannose-6-phosphate isomerase-like protein (cupin superfamily)
VLTGHADERIEPDAALVDDGGGRQPVRRGIKLYPAAGAVDNGLTGFRGDGVASPEAAARMTELNEAGLGSGIQSMLLFRQRADEGGFSAVLVWLKPNYPLVRHSHASDCMYFVISGSATMGNVTLRAGDSFFAPSGAPYSYTAGPHGIEVLEVRHGVESIGGTTVADPAPEVWDRFMDAVVANRERWATMDVSPTFAANQQR